jgi:plastocyanin
VSPPAIACAAVSRRLIAGLALTAAGVTACAGGGDDAEAGPTTLPEGVDLLVVGRDIFFTEDSYAAAAGEIAIRFENAGNITHDVRIRGNDEFDLNAGAGSTEDGTITLAAGSYEIYCSIAGHENMKAPLTVE